jgi:hypothetical protein
VSDKVNLPVSLHITDELRNAKWESADRSEGDSAALGESLAESSKKLVANVFSHPAVSAEKGGVDVGQDGAYVLTPRLIFSRYVHGGSAWDEARFTLCLEWRLTTASGQVKWIDTIKGSGKSTAFSKTGKLDDSLKMAMLDVFNKSQNAMVSSPLLRELRQVP